MHGENHLLTENLVVIPRNNAEIRGTSVRNMLCKFVLLVTYGNSEEFETEDFGLHAMRYYTNLILLISIDT